jgi:hypothetical protein
MRSLIKSRLYLREIESQSEFLLFSFCQFEIAFAFFLLLPFPHHRFKKQKDKVAQEARTCFSISAFRREMAAV